MILEPAPDRETTAVRRARNSRYAVFDEVLVPLVETEMGERPALFEPYPEPPLPVASSDLIIVGKIVSQTSYLSTGGTVIYTEYETQIERVLKPGSDQTGARLADVIVIHRLGGAIRHPSGKVLQVWIPDRRFPRVGGRYLHFLSKQRETRDYSIVKGYEIVCGKAYSLDILFDSFPLKFEGVSEERLIEALNAELRSAELVEGEP